MLFAKIAGCSSAWLERLVWDQEVAGSNPVTPIEATVRLKMNLAAQRLQSPDSSVKEVAEEFGFSDPFNFSRAFKRIFGIPPGTFKNLR
jgi:iron complex transport system substrate-binding protein